MRKLIVFVVLIMSGYCVMSHQTTELGVQVGAATYWGDVERANFSKSVTPVYGILGRWNLNKRLSVRGQLLSGNLQSDGFFSNTNIWLTGERLIPDEYPKDPDNAYQFNRNFQSVETLFEFNFRNYKLGSMKKESFTPFVAIGVGVLFSRAPRVSSFILEASEIGLPIPPLPGSGTYRPYLDANLNKTNNADIVTLTVPVGIGLKFNISKRLGGMVEVIVHKTFSDNIDNLDDPKRFQFDPNDPAVLDGTYQYPDKVSKFQLNNNDWFATAAFSLSYQLWSSKGVCTIYDKIKR